MSGYTEGPWEVGVRKASYRVCPASESERQILEPAGRIEFEALSVGTPRAQVAIVPLDESNRENARLIAAAPELLTALTQLLGGVERGQIQVRHVKNSHKAIAKATGETDPS